MQGNKWYVRYREDVIENGKLRRVRRKVFVGTKGDYPTQLSLPKTRFAEQNRVVSNAYASSLLLNPYCLRPGWAMSVSGGKGALSRRTNLRRVLNR